MKLPLSYIETWGTPELREAVAGHLRARRTPTTSSLRRRRGGALLAHAGARRAPATTRSSRCRATRRWRRSTLATGAEVSAWMPHRENGWALDLDELRGLLRPTTKLVAVNFPNNPTGYVPDEATFRELVALCDERGIRLFCDEVYRGIELDPARTPHPGRGPLRDGRLAERDVQVLRPAGPARGLARLPRPRAARAAREAQALHVHLQRRARGVPGGDRPAPSRSRSGQRNRGIIAANRPLFDDFFARWADLFDWQPPVGGCVCFPRYKGGDVEDFCRRLLDAEGVLVLPASMYYSEIADGARRPLPRRNRQAGPRGRRRRLRPVPAAHRTKFAARGRFRTAAVRYLLPLPAALILGASGSRTYLLDGPRWRSYRGALGGTHTRSCGRTADCVQGGSKCQKSCTSR